MDTNVVVASVFAGLVLGTAIIAIGIWLAIRLRNANRYDIPKYLPRDDERAWAIVTAGPKRIWSLKKCKYITYANWDLGILAIDMSIHKDYDTYPKFGDVILAPMKWGGFHACVITKELTNHQVVTTYLGEFDGQQQVIYDGRDRTGAKVIQ